MYLEINKILRNVSLTGLLSILLLSSCQDGLEGGAARNRQLRFTVVKGDGWHSSKAEALASDTVQVLQGCDDATPLYLHTLYTDSIASPSSSADLPSRATPVTGDNMYTSFGVSAYCYSDSWDETKLPNYFYNVTATKQGDSYGLATNYDWPGAGKKLRFFAYAPIDEKLYQFSSSTQGGAPTITCRCYGYGRDLLVAQTGEMSGDSNSSASLKFQHAMTAVKFVCGDDMPEGIIYSIRFRNIYHRGTYNFETESWNVDRTESWVSSSIDKIPTTGTPGEAISSEDNTLMMMPQTLPDSAYIELVFRYKSGWSVVLKADIGGTEWPMGKTVTYNLSTSSLKWDYVLELRSNPITDSIIPYNGKSTTWSLKSYRENSEGIQEGLPWTVQYSEDGGGTWSDTKPSWISKMFAYNTYDSGVSYNVTFDPQVVSNESPHGEILRSRTQRGTMEQPYNLANQTDGGVNDENTANCYVVNAPGYYSFPLVYGNAIKNGLVNFRSINSVYAGGDAMSSLLNHTSKYIDDPYISKNPNCTPDKAELLWQDAPNLVTDIKYNNTGNGIISFKVDPTTITQGNAIIAIKNASGQIMWSWHIWVTDEDLRKTIEVTNRTNYKYKFMPVYLGWCDYYPKGVYKEREVKVRLTNKYQSYETTIKQQSYVPKYNGNCPFYQWGRKDPLLPAKDLECSANKTWYNNEGVFTSGPYMGDIGDGYRYVWRCILFPMHMHNQSSNNWYINLWSINNITFTCNDNEVIKTVYDPSPVGFVMPPSNVYTRFSTTGGRVDSSSGVNGYWSTSPMPGWYLYTDDTKTNKIFFPAAGYRSFDRSGEPRHVGTMCCSVWTAHPASNEYGRHLVITRDAIIPLQANCRSYGYTVRPIVDE